MNPILFLHGVTRRARSFDSLACSLGNYRTSAVDFRGHGSAPRYPGGYRVVDYASDIEFPNGTILYGHSMGAMVAALLACERPNDVSALILEDPPFQTMGDRIRDGVLYEYFSGLQRFAGSSLPVAELSLELANLKYAGRRLGDERDAASLRFTASCLKLLDPGVLDPVLDQQWLEGYDVSTVLSGIQCPVLLLQADPNAGGMLIDVDASNAAASIRDCTLARFPGKPHLLHTMATEDVRRVVLAFLASCDSPLE